MATHPPDCLLVHPLPAAPNFVGREAELQELRTAVQAGFRGVLTLVGLGGAGKTAIAARFLAELTAPHNTEQPGGLFVWSFYQEPDAGLFLEQAHRYFSGETASAPPAKGIGLLHLLREALSQGGPHWLVLDGLERVQRQESSGTGSYGQIEDPLLRALLLRIAEGMGQTTALVTSRFPLTDLYPLLGRGYQHLGVAGLDLTAAQALLRQRGVQGDDGALAVLINRYGAHALTLDHLGGLIGQFLEGDPARAPEVAELADPDKDRQALRLARLLRAYEDHLPTAELALLCRLCLLRRSVTEEHIQQLFLCSPLVHARLVREVGDFVERFSELEKHLEVDQIRDLAEEVRSTLEETLCSQPIAGPVERFRSEIHALVPKVLDVCREALELDFGELAQLYADPAATHPTDLRPLNYRDREALRSVYARYLQLSEHPALSQAEPSPALEQAFQALGIWKPPPAPLPTEPDPAGLWRTLTRVKRRLRYLAGKHFALRRVRELCRVYQRKYTLAGPLAALEAHELRRVLEALVGRHLLLHEANGCFSVHPAVRDHFHHLATRSEENTWHDILREQLISLVQRPGKRHPEDPVTLDLAEDALYHALEAGRTTEALWLYHQVLGGLRQLAWKMGEMARGLRILRSFDPCPERWDLAWYLRALGELDAAFSCCELAYFRADILLLQGRLPEVAAQGDDARTAVAAFLMGQTTTLPPDHLAGAIPREQLWLHLGRLDRVRGALVELYQDFGWEGDRARLHLLLAEAARRQTDEAGCRRHLEAASTWVLNSGSVEHLCLLHLVRLQLAQTTGQPEAAQLALTEGLQLTRQCGLGLYYIEFLSAQAELFLGNGAAPLAEPPAREALQRASAPECQFLWGAAQAGQLVGEALLAQGRSQEARDFLEKTLQLRESIGHPGAAATERLLARLGDE